MMKTRSRLVALAVLTICATQTLFPRAHAEPAAPLTAANFAQIAADTDALLAGKSPSSATQDLFKTYDNNAHVYVRNPRCVAAGLDFSCVSVANSANADGTGGNRGCVTMITPLHGVTNAHFAQPNGFGVVHYFVDRTNTVYARKIVSGAPVGATDLAVLTFDSPLPASIQPAQLLPAGAAARLLLPGTPLLSTNQQKRVVITELAGFAGRNLSYGPLPRPRVARGPPHHRRYSATAIHRRSCCSLVGRACCSLITPTSRGRQSLPTSPPFAR